MDGCCGLRPRDVLCGIELESPVETKLLGIVLGVELDADLDTLGCVVVDRIDPTTVTCS
jgi:hypothetical protein